MSDSADRELPVIAPPVPAPYLAGIPTLPDDLLREMKRRRRLPLDLHRRARALLIDLRRQIDAAREHYQESLGVEIQIERPLQPRPSDDRESA